jgi:hypothetical protein
MARKGASDRLAKTDGSAWRGENKRHSKYVSRANDDDDGSPVYPGVVFIHKHRST